ncbi:MAG: hypothetical protein ABI895_08110 [Deltaproteobacteria bacterium]
MRRKPTRYSGRPASGGGKAPTVPAALLLLSLSALPSCGIGDFDVDRSIDEQSVRGNALSSLLDTFFNSPIPMNVNIREETSARDSGPAKSAHLTRLEFQITKTAMAAPDSDDFSFLDSVTVYVESTKAGSSLPREKIAEALDIKAESKLAFHTFDSVDVLPYSEEGARFVSEASGHAPPDDVTFNGGLTVTVELF